MKKQDFIKNIREDYSEERNTKRTLEGYAKSIETLADDLYAKDTHFIFELIQNAEDNSYNSEVIPFLHFTLKKLLNSETIVLLVENNENGFYEENVNSICKVGDSTKKKSAGFIGEKGIGFKSVFKITNCPSIFSNGFHFSLPKKDDETHLGYIVPSWVDQPPSWIDLSITNILLPLAKNISPKIIIDFLKEIAPETILFLTILKELKVSISLPGHEYEVFIKKETLTNSIIKLSYQLGGENVKEVLFWLNEKEFLRPENVTSEKRININRRTISVALPLDTDSNIEKLFAYLPVWENTGLPFLVNADFLLVSSREGLHENESWNIWLRDQISLVFSEGFLNALQSNQLTLEQKQSLYSTIPIAKPNKEFLNSIPEQIYDILRNEKSVLDKNGIAQFPKNTFIPYSGFRELLYAGHPKLLKNQTIVNAKLEVDYTKQLELINVKDLSPNDIEICFKDVAWLNSHCWSWLISCYQFLSGLNHYFDPENWPIIPISIAEKMNWLTPSSGEIFFKCSNKQISFLKEIPLSCRSELLFLPPDFYNLLKENKELISTLEEWGVKHFDEKKYLSKILSSITTDELLPKPDELINLTTFSIGIEKIEVPKKFPVISIEMKKVHTKEGLDFIFPDIDSNKNKINWLALYPKRKDQEHFCILSDRYFSNKNKGKIVSFFKKRGVQNFPRPKRRTEIEPPFLTPYEKTYFQKVSQAKYINQNFLPPTGILHYSAFSESKKVKISNLLISWLGKLKPNDYKLLEVRYRKMNRDHDKEFDSEFVHNLKQISWVPSEQGLKRPEQVFVRSNEIEDVFRENAPYLTEKLSEEIIEIFGIKTTLSTEDLIDQLYVKKKNDKSVSCDDLRWIYRKLERASDDELIRINKERLIYIPMNNSKICWVSPDECVWKKMNNKLSKRCNCLSDFYPELRNFFIEKLNVKEQLNSSDLIRILKNCLEEREQYDKDIIIEVYQQLTKECDENDIECLLSFRSVFIPKSKHWVSPNECIWIDDELEGSEHFSLEKIYPDLKEFFVNNLGIDEFLDEKSYADLWLQNQEENPSKKLIEKMYKKLRKSICSQEDDWVTDFLNKAMLYTTSDKFIEPIEIYLPNHAEIVDMFQDKINFAWKPPNDSWSSWNNFFLKFKLSPISDFTSMKLLNDPQEENITDENKYLTPAAIKMIASWIKENELDKYETLINNNVFDQLFTTVEVSVPQLLIQFSIESKGIKASKNYPIFWDIDTKKLYIKTDFEKDDLATHLARRIYGKTNFNLANWIENVLGSLDTKRLKKKNWNVPQEIIKLEKKIRKDLKKSIPTIPDSNITDEIPKVNTPEKRKTEYISVEDVNIEEGLVRAFDSSGKTEIDDSDQKKDDEPVKNPVQREEKKTEDLNESKKAPHLPPKIKITKSVVAKDPAIREALRNWYAGKCQICGETWAKRNGKPYFESIFLIKTSQGDWLEFEGNALCLCAKHAAQWQHATKIPKGDIINQIKSQKLQKEGGSNPPQIKFKLCGKLAILTYTEKHFVALRALINHKKSD